VARAKIKEERTSFKHCFSMRISNPPLKELARVWLWWGFFPPTSWRAT